MDCDMDTTITGLGVLVMPGLGHDSTEILIDDLSNINA